MACRASISMIARFVLGGPARGTSATWQPTCAESTTWLSRFETGPQFCFWRTPCGHFFSLRKLLELRAGDFMLHPTKTQTVYNGSTGSGGYPGRPALQPLQGSYEPMRRVREALRLDAGAGTTCQGRALRAPAGSVRFRASMSRRIRAFGVAKSVPRRQSCF